MGVIKRGLVGAFKGGPNLDLGASEVSGKTTWEVNFKPDSKMKLRN